MSGQDPAKTDDVDGAFRAGAARGEFLLQRDSKSGRSQFFPRPVNLFGESALASAPASGQGTLVAVTTARTGQAGPYQVGIVKLAEGPRVFARLVNAAADIAPGRAMRLTWEAAGEGGVRLYAFEPA